MLRIAVLASSKGTLAEFLGNDLRFEVRFDRKLNGPLHLSRHCWRNNRPVG
jgi:hypothetical protein